MADGFQALLHGEWGQREVAVHRLRAIAWLTAGVGSCITSVLARVPLWPALCQLAWGLVCLGLVFRLDLLRRWPVGGVGLSAIDALLIAVNTALTHSSLLAAHSDTALHQLHASGISFALAIATGALRFVPWQSAALGAWSMGFYVLLLARFDAVDTGLVSDLVLLSVLSTLTTYAAYRQRWLIQRRFERDALARYLPSPAVERIAKDPTDRRLGGAMVEATVMFCDIRGFTTLASQLPPEQVVATVNEWFSEAVAETHAHGGVVDKFVGDAILAVFDGPDDAARAVRCALGWQQRLKRLNETRTARGEAPLGIGTGAHRGALLAGNIGSTERLEYTHIGDVVNVAARVQDLTKQLGEPLLVTADVWQAARPDGVAGRDVGETQVRGREQPVRLIGVG